LQFLLQVASLETSGYTFVLLCYCFLFILFLDVALFSITEEEWG